MKHGGGWRVGEKAVYIGLHHVFPGEVTARQLGRFMGLEGLLADAEEANAGGHHEAEPEAAFEVEDFIVAAGLFDAGGVDGGLAQ